MIAVLLKVDGGANFICTCAYKTQNIPHRDYASVIVFNQRAVALLSRIRLDKARVKVVIINNLGQRQKSA